MGVFTSGIIWRSPTVQSHDYWSKDHVSLHTVRSDGINNVGGEVEVEVTEKHNAVFFLTEN